ncbi:MAG: cell surface protein [Rhizobacter sp.]
MRKNVLALSIAAMIGGLGFAGAASADVIIGTGVVNVPVGATIDATTGQWSAANTAIPNANLFLTPTTARGLALNQAGTGHSLVVPYFNAQNGNMTVLHVVNTDQINGKLTKVRFRSAANSDDILDFQVFLSPGDVWTAAVTAGADGVAQLTTADKSCTLPVITPGTQVPFITQRLSAAAGNINAQTREGYVEIFNMADIDSLSMYGTGRTAKSALWTATKHVSGTAPCTESVLNTTLVNFTTEAAARTIGLDTPTGGLMGDWYIINVPQSTTYAGAATALSAVANADGTGAVSRANFVHFPQNAAAAPNPDANTSDPLFRISFVRDQANAQVTAPAIVAGNYDLPDMSTPYTLAAAGAVAVDTRVQAFNLTRALAVTSITNQYANDAVVSAKTDWLFSMPTRRYSVAANYTAATPTAATYRLYTALTDAAGLAAAASPATAGNYKAWFAPTNTSLEGGLICVTANSQAFYDREETSRTAAAVFSPGLTATARFCGETSVLAFGVDNTDVSVLGASVARQSIKANAGNTSGPFVNGYAVVGTANGGNPTVLGPRNALTGLGTDAYNAAAYNLEAGLPIIGQSFIKLTNGQATPGTVGTYGITWQHRVTRP